MHGHSPVHLARDSAQQPRVHYGDVAAKNGQASHAHHQPTLFVQQIDHHRVEVAQCDQGRVQLADVLTQSGCSCLITVQFAATPAGRVGGRQARQVDSVSWCSADAHGRKGRARNAAKRPRATRAEASTQAILWKLKGAARAGAPGLPLLRPQGTPADRGRGTQATGRDQVSAKRSGAGPQAGEVKRQLR
jgi:hypothetical protein